MHRLLEPKLFFPVVFILCTGIGILTYHLHKLHKAGRINLPPVSRVISIIGISFLIISGLLMPIDMCLRYLLDAYPAEHIYLINQIVSTMGFTGIFGGFALSIAAAKIAQGEEIRVLRKKLDKEIGSEQVDRYLSEMRSRSSRDDLL